MVENNGLIGQIQISDEVIAIIAATAAGEVDGVVAGPIDPASAIVEFFGKKNQSRGVKVFVENAQTEITIEIGVRFGTKIHECAESVQAKVKGAVETMTGLEVVAVNVNIAGITIEKKPEYEMEEGME